MKYIKLFEEMNLENVKKYPYLFNIFVDPQYIKEEDYEEVNRLLAKSKKDITTPIFVKGRVYDMDGNLDFTFLNIERLPEYIKHVKGDLILDSCSNLKELPENLKIDGNLWLSDTPIKTLPHDLKVGGDIDLGSCKELISIPKDLKINGNLILNHSSIKELPENMIVGGHLNLHRCHKLNEIPNGLIVKGDLNLIGIEHLRSLPENMNIGGKIIIQLFLQDKLKDEFERLGLTKKVVIPY